MHPAILSQCLLSCSKQKTCSTYMLKDSWVHGIYISGAYFDPHACMIEMVFPKQVLGSGWESNQHWEEKCCNIGGCLEEEWGRVGSALEIPLRSGASDLTSYSSQRTDTEHFTGHRCKADPGGPRTEKQNKDSEVICPPDTANVPSASGSLQDAAEAVSDSHLPRAQVQG